MGRSIMRSKIFAKQNLGGTGGGTFPNLFYTVTYADLLSFITLSTLVSGASYEVTDVATNWKVIVRASSNSSVELDSTAIYYNTTLAIYTYFESIYDALNNEIIWVYDYKNRNTVESWNNISVFPWGNSNWTDNSITSSSTLILGGTVGAFKYNNIVNSTINLNSAIITNFINNNIEYSNLGVYTCEVTYSTIKYSSFDIRDNTQLNYVQIHNLESATLDTGINYNACEYTKNTYSNFYVEYDMSNNFIFDQINAVLNLKPNHAPWIGVYYLANSLLVGSRIIDYIFNYPTTHKFIFRTSGGSPYYFSNSGNMNLPNHIGTSLINPVPAGTTADIVVGDYDFIEFDARNSPIGPIKSLPNIAMTNLVNY